MGDNTIFGLYPTFPDPIFDPYKPSVDPNPFVPIPNFNVDTTTLARLYTLEQEVYRLKLELEELRNSHTQMDMKLTAAPEVVANAVVLAFDKARTPRAARKAPKSKKTK